MQVPLTRLYYHMGSFIKGSLLLTVTFPAQLLFEITVIFSLIQVRALERAAGQKSRLKELLQRVTWSISRKAYLMVYLDGLEYFIASEKVN